MDVINRWKLIAASSRTQWINSTDHTVDDLLRAAGAVTSLKQMSQCINTGAFDHVLALVGDDAARDIQAMSVVQLSPFTGVYDEFGKLATVARERSLGAVPDIVHIESLTATPIPGRRKGIGAELIHRIAAWARAAGHLVVIAPADDAVARYYETLGFEYCDSYMLNMVYNGYRLRGPVSHQELRMVALEA